MSKEIPEVFISATSRDLGTVRDSVKTALLTMGCHPVEQGSFPPGENFQTISERIRELVDGCEAVIHIVGMRYGEEPANRPASEVRLSYTQMEADLARKLNKSLYVFICPPDFPYDEAHADHPEDEELQELQLKWRNQLGQSDGLFTEVGNKLALETKIRELQIELGSLRKKIALGNSKLTLAVASAAAALLLLAGAGGWLVHTQDAHRKTVEKALQSIRSDPKELTARLRQNIEEVAATRLEEAGDDWSAKMEIERERDQQLLRVDDLIEVIQNGISEDSNPIFDRATAILVDQENGSAGKALEYLESQRVSLLTEVQRLSGIEEDINKRKRDKLRPLLLEAGIHENRFEWEEALDDLNLAVKLAPDWWEAQHLLGTLLKNRAKLDKAESCLRLALAIAPSPKDKATSESSLAQLLEFQGNYKDAETHYRKALESRTTLFGKEDPATLASVSELAFLLRFRGRYDEAFELLGTTVELQRDLLGEKHPDTLDSISSLASVLKSKSFYAEAEPLFQEALKGRQEVLGADHPSTLSSMNNLAFFYESTGKYDAASPLYENTLAARARVLGENHPNTLTSKENIAALAMLKGDLEKADRIFREVLGARENILGRTHPATIATKSEIAYLCSLTKNYEEAERIYREVLEVRDQTLQGKNPDTIGVLNDLASVLIALKKTEEAGDLLTSALAQSNEQLEVNHPLTISILHTKARLLETLNDPAAREYYEKVYRGMSEKFGIEDKRTLHAKKDYDRFQQGSRRAPESERVQQ